LAQPLYEAARGSLTESLDPAKPIKTPFVKLQQALLQAPALSLSNLKDPFKLYVTKRGGMALGVLGQMKGPTFAPVAYLSKQLDLVIKGGQPCLSALAAATLLTQEASKLTFESVLSPHRLTDLLSHCCLSNLSPLRLQLFHLTSIEKPDVILQTCPPLNPATLLPDGMLLEHSCLETLETLTYCQPHLSCLPLPDPDVSWFLDGSSSLDTEGKRHAGYAVVSFMEVIKSSPLPWGTTSQKAELIALTRALTLAKDILPGSQTEQILKDIHKTLILSPFSHLSCN
jgi:hypothetical protein